MFVTFIPSFVPNIGRTKRTVKKMYTPKLYWGLTIQFRPLRPSDNDDDGYDNEEDFLPNQLAN